MYSTPKKEHSIHFVNAFDKLQEQRRKLFNIPEIDNLLNFSDKKNVCIVNRGSKNTSYNFLDNIIVVRAFTFYQLANIIIDKIPQFMNNLDCNTQIIVIDLLGTLFKI